MAIFGYTTYRYHRLPELADYLWVNVYNGGIVNCLWNSYRQTTN